MGDGFDQVGKKNMMRENREKRRKYDELRKDAAWRRGHEDDGGTRSGAKADGRQERERGSHEEDEGGN